MTQDFHGAKAAIFIGPDVLLYQRDRAVRWPGYWDFAGGGREERETPFECLRREVHEEFGLNICQADITWAKAFPAMVNPAKLSWFFVVQCPLAARAQIRFGTEGQRWALRPLGDVANMPNLVPALRGRLTAWLHDTGQDPI